MSDRSIYTHQIVDWVLIGTGLAIIIAAVAILLAVLPAAHASERKHVYIHKPPPIAAQQPATAPLRVVPPIAMAFDLVRRTSCDPAIAVSTGKGDPGFDLVDGPKTGNFLIPAIYRSQCVPVATPQRRRR